MGGFIAIIIFTTIFYLVFSQLREQVCTTICPYGRLQGVLLDENSMVVAYDHKRGENRQKLRKKELEYTSLQWFERICFIITISDLLVAPLHKPDHCFLCFAKTFYPF